MLGSAIPKRWVVSLALVGLVSLFMASYAAVWTGSASAEGTTVAGHILTDLQAPTSLNLQTGQSVGLSVLPINDLGVVNLNMESIVYSWLAGSCGSMSGATTSRTPTFTASNGACTGTISVHANQGAGDAVPSTDRLISVSVAAPPPVPTAAPAPTDPAVIPNIVPAGLSAEDVAVILPSSGGTFSVPQSDGMPISINIPSGALDSGTAVAVTINVVSVGDVAPPPQAATEGATSGTFRFGSTIIGIQWYDDSGAALDTFHLNRPAEICLPYSQADLDAADRGPDGLGIWWHGLGGGAEWVLLNSTVNTGDRTVCVRALDFSFFALGLSVAVGEDVVAEVTPEPEPELPATGDYAPGMGALALVMLAGVALVGTGAFAARRARRVRETS